jgi:hypothetical protein
MGDAFRRIDMLYLVFGHTAQDPPLRLGPMASFELHGAQIVDAAGCVVARHNGHRWAVQGRDFYRMDCAGPLVVKLENTTCGPFEHFSLVNGTAYASRDLFAHYSEQDGSWHLHNREAKISTLLVTPA